MLRKYEKIDDAMSACVALEYPLIIVVHSKLPTNLNNAEEAARGSGSGTAPTYSFLPPSYSTGTSNAFMNASLYSSSLFTNDTVPLESTLAAPSQDAANANASLGYLMRPANLSATAVTDRAVVAAAVADGEELTLVNNFPLGSLQGGAAQREALLITLLESRLGSVTLLHLIEEGTPAYDSFSAAVPPVLNGAGGTAAAAPTLPRVHVFYAPKVGLSPMVLHGATLTPQNLFSCVQMGFMQPRNRAEGGDGGHSVGGNNAVLNASAAASSLRSFFTSTVASMNREYERSRQHATLPGPSHNGPASTTPTTAEAGVGGAAAAPPIIAAPAVRAAGVSRADALAMAHLISVAGLPTCFSTGPIPGSPGGSGAASTTPSSHKTILTTPAMTMQTVWRAVEKHLDWAQHEVQLAQEASMWNGVTPPKPGAKFTLTVAKSDTEGGSAVEVTTLAEAARVRLQDFPRNTVVHVIFEDWSPVENTDAPVQQQQQQQTPPQQKPSPAAINSSAPPSEYVCEGDVCRRRLPGEVDTKPSEAPPVSPPLPASSSSSSPTSPPAPAASIKLHCSLPNGKTLAVDQLDPNVDTLQAGVRPQVEAALGYSNFIFVCAYPAKRYSPEVDEPRLLKDIGLTRSSALRVVAVDGAGAPSAASAPGQSAQASSSKATRQMLANAASSLLGMFGGRRANPHTSGGAPPSAPAGPRRTYNSMAEMLAANEAAERETAIERLRQEQQQQQQPFMGQDPADAAQQQQQHTQRKKSNRYFGGSSTEYIAEDDLGSGGGDDPRRAVEGMTAEQQGAFLREQLQRLMQQQRSRTEGSGDDREEEEEGQGRQRVAFQGQGRRLAGDGASLAANAPSSPAATPPVPSPPSSSADAPAAKKNQ